MTTPYIVHCTTYNETRGGNGHVSVERTGAGDPGVTLALLW